MKVYLKTRGEYKCLIMFDKSGSLFLHNFWYDEEFKAKYIR